MDKRCFHLRVDCFPEIEFLENNFIPAIACLFIAACYTYFNICALSYKIIP